MIFGGRGILLDVEGTTSSIRYVYDVLFPFARRELSGYLATHWGSLELMEALNWVAKDAGKPDFDTWLGQYSPIEQRAMIHAELDQLIQVDAKTTGLKQIQGLVWRSGFERGELCAHVFSDVPEALCRWRQRNIEICIYSSGSIEAQRLFFSHTLAGDLTPYLAGHFDTTTGAKRDPESYRAIARAFGTAPENLLFLSDIPEELHAARNEGWQTALVLRPGNAPAVWDGAHIENFDQIL